MPANDIVLELLSGPGNPRNSEGAFATLSDGRLLFAYTRFEGTSGSDHGTAVIAARTSADDGRTWSREDRVLVPNEGECNVMSVSLLRLHDGRLALFYCRKNTLLDCRHWLRTSTDDGATWSEATCCIPAPGYFVVNNDRIVQLRSGRLIMPTALHRCKGFAPKLVSHEHFDGRGIALFFLSDDGGATWHESKDWWALPVRASSGLQEPGVVELKGGRLWAWCRTSTGRQWELFSRDRGETWSAPRPSRFRSPNGPLSLKRIPATGDLLAVWNDHSGRYPLPPSDRKPNQRRCPLALAISRDEGKTWRHHRALEDDFERGYCYTAIHFTADAVLLAYCCAPIKGGQLRDTRLRRCTLDWLYGRTE
jgi:Neuraminidase (sialidase)